MIRLRAAAWVALSFAPHEEKEDWQAAVVEDLAVPGLRFKMAQILSYDGVPLAEIAYVDSRGAPVLFCIIANGGADAPTRSERRGDYSLTSWSHAGRSYLVVGQLPEQQTTDLARTLEKRFSKS